MAVSVVQAGELTVTLIRLMRLMIAQQRQGPRIHERVDPVTQPLLFKLSDSPLRVSELAELTYSDISTVSRHVSNLERCGLVAKLPDPADGRAARAALTDEGRRAVERARAANAERMRRALASWDDDEVAQLVGLLHRLATDIDATPVTETHPAAAAAKGIA